MKNVLFRVRARIGAVGLICLAVGGGWAGCSRNRGDTSAPIPSGQLRVYIPCGYWLPMSQIKARFEKQFPTAKIEIKTDKEGSLIQSLVGQKEWPDIVICPGQVEMNALLKKDVVRRADRHAIGQFEVLLYVPRDNPGRIEKIQDLAKPEVKQIALPDPQTSSLGFFVRQSLEKLALWPFMGNKIVTVDNWRQCYKKILNQEIEASFAYDKCPIEKEKSESLPYRIIGPLPEQAHGLMLLEMGITTRCQNRILAEALTEFLLRDETQALLPEIGMVSKPIAEIDHLELLAQAESPANVPGQAAAFSLPEPLGSRQAKVFIYAVIATGEECQERIKNHLIKMGETYPDQILIYFANANASNPNAPATSPDGVPPLSEFGQEVPAVHPPFCGYVCINGKMEWTLPAEGDEEDKEVIFSGPPGEDEYFTLPDLERAIRQEIQAQYGKVKGAKGPVQDAPATQRK